MTSLTHKYLQLILAATFLAVPFSCSSPASPAYKNSSVPVRDRVADLLARMSPEEKFWQLFMVPGDLSEGKEKYRHGIFGLQVRPSALTDPSGQIIAAASSYPPRETARKINAIQKYFVEETRLGIPIIPFEEALHGLVSPGAISYPVPIALAATWDTALVHKVSAAIGLEARAHGYRDVLSPVVNIADDPRWGRTEETYGEDPFLSSAMGVAFVSALEQNGVITTPKHFLANSGAGGRDSYPIDYDERALEEVYLPPFRACISQGGSRSIMTSYNSVNGSPSTANDWLLNKKLKGDLNFRGIIISDAGAVGGANVLHFTAKDYEEATINSMRNGGHVIFQTSVDHYKLFQPPFLDGRIDQALIDSAVARVLRVKFELGLFEMPYVDENPIMDTTLATGLAKDAALKSIVLLKNDDNLLPLDKSISKLAVIGVDALEARLGGYSRPGKGMSSVLDGIKGKLGPRAIVTYRPGPGRQTPQFVPVSEAYLSNLGSPGLSGEYFNNIDLQGEPVLKRNDSQVNFRWTLYPPDSIVNFDFFSVRWTGTLRSPATGRYKIGLEGNEGYRLYLDDKLIIDNWQSQTVSARVAEFNFVKGREYKLRVEFFESSGVSSIKLIWNVGITDDSALRIREAIEAARHADVVVVVAGIEEGEGLDRAHLSLPGHQEEMIRQIAATGRPVVVMLAGGSAITLSGWINQVKAVLDIWYPGDRGGEAVADILFGDRNPSGKLPISFPFFEGQLPYVYHHKPTGRNDDYADLTGQPMFPFGFGLSYTSFQYSGLVLSKSTAGINEDVTVRFRIKNSGKQDGEEVVQLYIRDLLSSVAQPVKQLKGFQRVFLRVGEEKELAFTISAGMLKILNPQMKWVVEPGEFRIMIGSSSRDIRLRAILTMKE